MNNVPSVCDSRLQFAEWFKRISWMAFGYISIIYMNEFWKSVEEDYFKRVNDIRMDKKPPYLWHFSDYGYSSGRDEEGKMVIIEGHVLFGDSYILKLIKQFKWHEI